MNSDECRLVWGNLTLIKTSCSVPVTEFQECSELSNAHPPAFESGFPGLDHQLVRLEAMADQNLDRPDL